MLAKIVMENINQLIDIIELIINIWVVQEKGVQDFFVVFFLFATSCKSELYS